MNIDAIRRVNAINRGKIKPSKGEKETYDTIKRIVAKADQERATKASVDRVVVEILTELAAMDTYGLPKDATLATAAGTLTVRSINRAKWALPRLNKR